MTDEQILKAAIEKAVEGGWDSKEADVAKQSLEMCFAMEANMSEPYRTQGKKFGYNFLIFRKSFAKAFWKDCGDSCRLDYDHDFEEEWWTDNSCCGGGCAMFNGESWQYHLQQMVLEEEPLQYLKQFLNQDT